MIRILFIGSFLSKKCGTLGVSENLARQLQSKNLRIRLVSSYNNKYLRLLSVIAASLTLRYDKMHIDAFSGNAFRIAETASTIAGFRKKRIILTLHGGKLPEFYLQYSDRVKRVLNRAERVQTPSKYLQAFFEQQSIDIRYLPNSIDLSKFPYSRFSVKPKSLLWVRAFTDIYNPDLAIKTLFEIRKTFPDSTLTMIGPDKGLLGGIRKLIKQLDLQASVEILGPIPNDVLYTYYQTHEVFLNTTSYESFGVAVMEAAACGIPIVSTKVGEIPYLWKHNENMMIVDDFNPKLFATQIIKLLMDKKLAERLSLNARKIVLNFDSIRITEKWQSVLYV